MGTLDRDTVIYLAAFTDGEGYIGITRHKRPERRTPAYEPRLQVGNTSKEVLALYCQTFGGKLIHANRLTQSGKEVYIWYICGVPMVRALEAMLPYLRIKQEPAKLVIALHRRIERRSEREGDSKGISQSELEAREKLYQQIKPYTGKYRQLSFEIKGNPQGQLL